MKKILVIGAVLMLILINTKESDFVIPDSAIRFRIVANSNSIHDQTIKNNLERKLESYLFEITKDATSSKDAKQKLLDNYQNIEQYVKNYMDINKITSNFNISIGHNYFPLKKYKGVTYEAGYYDSIVVNLGNSQGINWWCVIYPPLCLLDKEEKSTDIEYTSYIKEVFSKYNL